MHRYFSYLLMLCIGTIDVSMGASLSLGEGIQLPAGVRLRPPRGFSAAPSPAPRIFTYENPATRQRTEAVDPIEQWRAAQLITTFTGEHGSITIARAKHAPVGNVRLLGGKHVIKEDFMEVLAKSNPPRKDKDLASWIESWSGVPIQTAEAKVHGFLLRTPYIRFTLRNQPRHRDQFWLLAHKQGPLMIRFQFTKLSGADADRTVSAVIRSVSETRPHSQPRRNNGESTELAEAKDRVIQGIRNVPGWWTVDTPNYVIASDLDRRSRALVDLLRRDVELIRTGYAALFPPVKPIKVVSVIRVFANTKDYQAYVSPELRWTGGIWDPSRKELVISGDQKSASSRELRENVLNTAWHEAFHQYLFYALDYREPPIWLNEGHACLFESCEIDVVRGEMRIKDNEPRRKRLIDMLKRRPRNADLGRLLTMTRDHFYVSSKTAKSANSLRADHYALAWGLTWFLRKGAPLYDNPTYYRIIPDSLMVLRETRDTAAAAAAGAKVTNLNALQRDFEDFWQDKRKQSRAQRNRILPKLK